MIGIIYDFEHLFENVEKMVSFDEKFRPLMEMNVKTANEEN